MENRNNGQGIFYAVIGVATLVVTIIGATFAFFSATTNSNNGAITASSSTPKLKYTDIITGLKSNLIPVDATNANFPRYPDVAAEGCVDVNSNMICSVYEFTVANKDPDTNQNIPNAQRIYVTLEPSANSFTNLHYAVFKGTSAQVKAKTAKFDVDGTPVTTVSDQTKHTIGTNGDLVIADTALVRDAVSPLTLAPLEQVLDSGESVTYTIVLWVQEQNADQTTADGGKSFAAKVKVTTASGSTGVTGVLSATGGVNNS